MKKLPFLLLIALCSTAPLFSQQNSGPVYFDSLFIGPYICEFAVNGPDKDMIREIEHYVQNGRIYFIGAALPISTGNLRPGFEFNLDLAEDIPRIKALYRGSARGSLPQGVAEGGIFVAGYAERGSIIITQVFFDEEELDKWTATVRLASQM